MYSKRPLKIAAVPAPILNFLIFYIDIFRTYSKDFLADSADLSRQLVIFPAAGLSKKADSDKSQRAILFSLKIKTTSKLVVCTNPRGVSTC